MLDRQALRLQKMLVDLGAMNRQLDEIEASLKRSELCGAPHPEGGASCILRPGHGGRFHENARGGWADESAKGGFLGVPECTCPHPDWLHGRRGCDALGSGDPCLCSWSRPGATW